jgi:hypothetical protein
VCPPAKDLPRGREEREDIECHDTEFKRLKSAQKAMKKHLSTLQDEITIGYGLPGKDEHDNQDNTT